MRPHFTASDFRFGGSDSEAQDGIDVERLGFGLHTQGAEARECSAATISLETRKRQSDGMKI